MEVVSTSVSSKSQSVDVLLDHFECKTSKIIDVITPEKVKILSGKQKAPWRNSPAVTNQKRERRKAESKQRKINLPNF